MALRSSQIIAALGIGALLAAGTWASLNGDVAADRQSRVDQAGWEAQTRLETATRRAETAGAAAAAMFASAGDAAFDAAATRLVDAFGAPFTEGLRLEPTGVADFIVREGRLALRRARAAAPDAAESVSADVRRSARLAAEGLAAQGPDRAFAARLAADADAFGATPDAAPSFWLVWPADGDGRAFGARFTLADLDAERPTPSAEPRWRFEASLSDWDADAALGAPEDATALARTIEALFAAAAADGVREVRSRARAPIGDGEIAIDIVSPPRGFSTTDLRAAAPTLAVAFTFALALLIYVRAEKRDGRRKAAELKKTLQETRAARIQLEDSRKKFQHLAESTNVVPWEADLDQQRFTYVGPQIEELCGYPAEAWRASGFWVQHIHPGDRRHVLVDTLRQVKEGEFARVHYRIRAADGGIRHVRNMLSVQTETVGDGATARKRQRAQGFLLDVTELHEASDAMSRAKRQAEDANRVKSEFLASMSHELRTPLNAIIGFSEIMKDQLFGPMDEKYREYSESVHTSGRHLLNLINDVLDLSKIEAGRIELVEEETDIEALLGDCRSLLHERISNAGLHAKMDVAANMPLFLLDERRLKQVVLNLLSNAIKFTPPGGAVTLRAVIEPRRGLLIAVRDTGIGMTKEEIPRALSKFGQIDGDLARKHDGTGLGLPIAKSLVEMHGGAFEIASEKNVGTEMRIWLPLARMVRGAA